MGILGSSSFRASHIFYLNDSSESKLLFETALSLLERVYTLVAACEEYPELAEEIGLLFVPYQRGRNLPFFVISLSEEWDDLSQWRGYTRPGNGYSLIWDHQSLERSALAQGWRLAPCLYENELNALLVPFLTDAFERIRVLGRDQARVIAQELYDKVIEFVPLVKHSGFRSENEWRLVSPLLDPFTTKWSYRAGASHMIPFVDFLLEPAHLHPLLHVNVGPGPNSDLAAQAVGSFLMQSGYGCGYGISSIPYRSW